MKKKLAVIALVLLSAFVLAPDAMGQWEQTSGPEGGAVQCIAIHGSTIFAGAGTGISVSTDHGMTWKFGGFENRYISAIIVDSPYVFAGTDSGIFRTQNNGVSWESVNAGLTDMSISAFALAGSKLIASTSEGAIYRTSDNGATWKDIRITPNSPINSPPASSLAVIGNTVFAATDYQLYISADFGTSWRSTDMTFDIITSLTAIGGDLYAGDRVNDLKGGPLLHSADSGQTWEQLINLEPYYTNAISRMGNTLILGTGGEHLNSRTDGAGILLSSGPDTSWVPSDKSINSATIYSFVIDGNKILAGSDEGILISTDTGRSWTRINTGLKASSVPNIIAIGNSLFAGASGSGVFRSDDKGSNWNYIGKDIGSGTIQDLKTDGHTLFAATQSDVFHSVNNGITWQASDKASGLGWFVRSLAVIDSTIFAGLGDMPEGGTFYGDPFVSTDGGVTWTEIDQFGAGGDYVEALVSTGQNLFFKGSGGRDGFFVSTDKGITWKDINSQLPNTNGYPLDGSGSKIIITTDTGLFLSSNNGTSWINIHHGLPAGYVSSLIQIGKIFFVGTYGSGVFLSTNSGADWKAINEGLFPNIIESVFINDGILYAGTYGAGIWKRALSDFGINSVQNANNLDPNISLSPNPTTGILSIRNAPENLASISILNVLGEKMMEVTGPHSTEFTIDVSHLTAGMYYVRFFEEKSIVARKILKE